MTATFEAGWSGAHGLVRHSLADQIRDPVPDSSRSHLGSRARDLNVNR